MWNDQDPRKDKSGRRWNFTIWYDVWTEDRVVMAHRLFFWDDAKTECGVILFLPGFSLHRSRIKKLIQELVADPDLRKKYRRELHFPLKRHYSEFGAFLEEASK